MSGRGKVDKEKTTKRRRIEHKCGLTFSVSRVRGLLRRGRYARHIGVGASVYLAAVLEYLVAEVMELGGNAARDNRKKKITPRHVQLAIRNDEELDRLLHGVTIARGGVMPNIHACLVPPKSILNKAHADQLAILSKIAAK